MHVYTQACVRTPMYLLTQIVLGLRRVLSFKYMMALFVQLLMSEPFLCGLFQCVLGMNFCVAVENAYHGSISVMDCHIV